MKKRLSRKVLHLACFFLLGQFSMAPSAFAHADHPSTIVPLFNNLSQLPSGVTLSIVKSVDHQLVMRNTSTHTVEVLDDSGRAFIRVEPQGAYVDVNAVALYRTQGPIGSKVPDRIADGKAAADWKKVSEPSEFGWFDERIRIKDLEDADPRSLKSHAKPYTSPSGQHLVSLGTFMIPVRIDGQPLRLRGNKILAPEPTGLWQQQLLKEPDWPEVSVIVATGGAPAVILKNESPREVTVMDDAHQPLLRISSAGAYGNTSHPWWPRLNIAGSGSGDPLDAGQTQSTERWVKDSDGNQLPWVDPRLRTFDSPLSQTNTAKPGTQEAWSIPLLRAADELNPASAFTLQGTQTWTVFKPPASGRTRSVTPAAGRTPHPLH